MECAIPMLVTLSGMVTLVRLAAVLECELPMLVTLSGNGDARQASAVMECELPMLVTLLGMVMLVRPVQSSNASSRCW